MHFLHRRQQWPPSPHLDTVHGLNWLYPAQPGAPLCHCSPHPSVEVYHGARTFAHQRKGNNQQSEKAAYEMGENIC